MNRYFDKLGIDIKMEPGDEEILQQGTVDFVSFSYYFLAGVHQRPKLGKDLRQSHHGQ